MIIIKFKYKQIGKISLGFTPGIMLENILKSRGITSPNDFLSPSEKNIEDFHLFDNIKNGVKLLDYHIVNHSKIVIVVDADSDGYTSASELYLYLQQLYSQLNFPFNIEFITHSKKAHGLTNEVMLKIEEGKYNLVILPDASSNEYKQHKVLYDNGINVLVLDHHQCDKYSEHAVVINNQLSNRITNKSMTGVGVTYKFCKALDEYYGINFADDYLDLIAFGMIADHCDLTNLESRYIVLKGLDLIKTGTNKNKFLKSIYEKKSYNMNQKITISNVEFYMCPYVNCIIRGGDKDMKRALFNAFIGLDGEYSDEVRGKGIVKYDIYNYMHRLYDKLKRIQDKEKEKGVEVLSNQIEEYGLNKCEIMVVNGQGLTNSAYNRVIVNQLCSNYRKHCILLKEHKGELRGSAAGCKNRNITDLREWCKNSRLFSLAEGHKMAFGVSVPVENINKLYEVISQISSNDILEYNVDYIFTEKTINKATVEMIARYKDLWGSGVEEPLFAIENIVIESNPRFISLLGKTKNTIKIHYNGIEIVKFNSNEEIYNDIMKNKYNKFTIIGKFDLNEYNGNIIPQIKIEDISYEEVKINNPFRF